MTTDYDELRRRRMEELDEEHQEFYAGPQPNLGDVGVEAVRGVFVQRGLADGPLREGVTVETIDIPGPVGPVRAKIYRPEGRRAQGLYVHFHHGGFVAMGGLDHVDGMNSAMVEEYGCAILYPDFRLPPEDKFPAGIEDCWAVMQWVDANTDELGVDPQRIAVGGGCTGATMAAVMALMARDAGSPSLALQVLWGPQLDCSTDYLSQHEFATGYGLSRQSDEWVVDQYLDDPADQYDWRASPVLAPSMRGLPPAVISVGEWEVLRDQARLYADRLRDAGVEVTYLEGASLGHAYTAWRSPTSGEMLPVAREHREAIASAIRTQIGD